MDASIRLYALCAGLGVRGPASLPYVASQGCVRASDAPLLLPKHKPTAVPLPPPTLAPCRIRYAYLFAKLRAGRRSPRSWGTAQSSMAPPHAPQPASTAGKAVKEAGSAVVPPVAAVVAPSPPSHMSAMPSANTAALQPSAVRDAVVPSTDAEVYPPPAVPFPRTPPPVVGSTPSPPHAPPPMTPPDPFNDPAESPFGRRRASTAGSAFDPDFFTLTFDDDLTNPIVIDNGSYHLRSGRADDDKPDPRASFPNMVGFPKGGAVLVDLTPGRSRAGFVGHSADRKRALLDVKQSCEGGVIQDWDSMEQVWEEVFSVLCGTNAAKAIASTGCIDVDVPPVLLTMQPNTPLAVYERAAQMLFELFNATALFFAPPQPLALFARGRTTGLVADIGYQQSRVVPVYEGHVVSGHSSYLPLGGLDITRNLDGLLRKETGVEGLPIDVLRRLKESKCHVAVKYDMEMYRTAVSYEELQAKREEDQVFQLPDGNNITIGPAAFQAAELLFEPQMVLGDTPCDGGLDRMCATSIRTLDVEFRSAIASEITLCGGSGKLPGLGTRLKESLMDRAATDASLQASPAQAGKVWQGTSDPIAPIARDVKVVAPASPEEVWRGGAVLSSLPRFQRLWVTRQQFEDGGEACIHRNWM